MALRVSPDTARRLGVKGPKKTPKSELERLQAKAEREKWEDVFADQLTSRGIDFVRQAQPCYARRWRVDFLLSSGVIVEIEGGVWNRGRHNRPDGFIADSRKYNKLTSLGYIIYRFVPEDVESGAAIEELLVGLALGKKVPGSSAPTGPGR